MTRYRTGPELVSLFNEFGCRDKYGPGFPSRWTFAEEKLAELNGRRELRRLIERVFDPLEFHDVELVPGPAIESLNPYLERDGYEVVVTDDGRAKVLSRSGDAVTFRPPESYEPSSQEFVAEHLEKCNRKLAEGDFRGAVTNARSLCEEVLRDIERQMDPTAARYNGDLPKLYKRVRRLLNMDPSEYVDRDSVLVLLSGLTTVVDGLAGMSNALGDRHGGGGVPAKEHHARLAVNAANSLCTYLVSSFIYQRTKS